MSTHKGLDIDDFDSEYVPHSGGYVAPRTYQEDRTVRNPQGEERTIYSGLNTSRKAGQRS